MATGGGNVSTAGANAANAAGQVEEEERDKNNNRNNKDTKAEKSFRDNPRDNEILRGTRAVYDYMESFKFVAPPDWREKYRGEL